MSASEAETYRTLTNREATAASNPAQAEQGVDDGLAKPRVLWVRGGRPPCGWPAAPGALAADPIARHLEDLGLAVTVAFGADDGTTAARAALPAVALVELRSGTDDAGLAALEAFRRLWPRLPVIALSARPTVPEAVCVMQAGAETYLPAQAAPELTRAVRTALERPWARAAQQVRPEVTSFGARSGVVGTSAPMTAMLRQLALVAPTRTTVLLLGETGTGKERLAQALHEASPRRRKAFVAVNCAALAETLLESELFGHERGAFSGAHSRREGRFALADGGTIFLDEIGEVPLATQVKLLRVLQERRFERVGGNETLSVDVRVIAATNRNLRQMVEEKSFRADLFYRLNVMSIEVPPLRARQGDVPLLVEHILPRLALELGMPEPDVADEALAQLVNYDWPGNVRELENVLERALVLAQGGVITGFDLPRQCASVAPLVPGAPASPGTPVVPGASFRDIERHAIMTTYEACGRSPLKTAEVLGISPRTVHYRLREYRGEPGRRLPRGGRDMDVSGEWSLQSVRSVARRAEDGGQDN